MYCTFSDSGVTNADTINSMGIEIGGRKDEWGRLARFLLGEPGEFPFNPMDDPIPYGTAAARLVLVHNDADHLKIDIDSQGNLYVAGTRENCARMSGLVLHFGGSAPGDNMPYDWISYDYLSKDSANVTFYMIA